MSRKVFLWRRDGAEPETLVVEGRAKEWNISGFGSRLEARVSELPDGRLSILLSDGRQLNGRVTRRTPGEVGVSTSRGLVRLSLADPLHDRLGRSAVTAGSPEGEEEVRALMPGRVLEVSVASGDSVEKGALLLVIEAMKMQNEIRAEHAGLVGRVAVGAGEAVDGGAILLTVQSVKS